jgi:Protein of unknown function (DUF3108).
VRDVVSGYAAIRLVALRNAIRSQAGRLLHTEGWAANAELFWRTARYARRVETVSSVERHDLRSRPSRVRPWEAATGLVRPSGAARLARAAGPARGLGATRGRATAGVVMTRLLLALALFQAPPAPSADPVAAYPWAVGEKLTYSAKLGLLTLGSGTLEVAGIDTVRGMASFRFRFRLQGKTIVYSMDDVLESFVGTKDMVSRRFLQDFVENGKASTRHYEIVADSGYFREEGKPGTQPAPADALDDAAFFYFVRVTDLEVGKTYKFDRYFRKEKNPVTVEVTKREKMELPDGREVDCLVLHPVIDTKGCSPSGPTPASGSPTTSGGSRSRSAASSRSAPSPCA